MKQYENKGLGLAKFLLDFDYVIIDTCSLMERSFPVWMDRLVLAREYLSGTKCNIYVHQESIGELQKLARDKREFDRYASTKRALKIIRHAKWQKLLKILKKQKKSEKNFADNAIYVKVSLDRLNQKILKAPAILLYTEHNEQHTSKWKNVIGNKKILQIHNRSSFTKRLDST